MKGLETAGSPHWAPPTSIRGVMLHVLLALIPGVLAHWYFFGIGILIQIILAVSFALFFEALALKIRGRDMRLFLTDLSAPLTAVLFALCLPPMLPWWASMTGMFFAIIVAKHLYGGLGHNPFNPAMVGYAVVLISFPVHATHWLAPAGIATYTPDFQDVVRAILFQIPPGDLTWDAISEATPLDVIRTGASQGIMIPEIRGDAIFGDFGGRGWEWIANCYALGGLFLLWRKVITWHVPVAMILATIIASSPFWLANPDVHPAPLEHVFTGGLILGAFFIATDPVSGCTTRRGKIIFGVGVGLLTLIIRRWGSFPDGVAFAVLLMNMAAPFIDRHVHPRTFGK